MAEPLNTIEAKTMNHLENMEGWRAQGYVPSNRSGVTIGYGIDLSQPPYNTEEGLRANGFSQEFISKAVELGVLGKDAEALGGINKAKRLARQLTISDTEEEKVRQFRLVQEKVNKRAEKYNGKMDEDAFISYKTLNHWSGGGLSKEQRDNISEKDLKRGIRNPYTRKAYVAGVIEDELDRIYKEQGYVTNEQYQAAILKGKNSVPKFEKNSPLNSRTLDREIEMVSSNSNTSVTNDNYEEVLATTPPSLPEVEVGGGRVITNLDPVAEGEEVVEEIYASDNTNENIEEFERYTQTAYGDGFEVRQKDGRMVIVKMPVPEGEPEPTPNYEEVEDVDEMNYTTYVNQGRTIEPSDPPQPQVLDADGNIVDQPTDQEGEAALREEEERQRQEEDEAERPEIIKRGEDAKEYQKLIKRNKTLRAAYKPADMPSVFSREIRNNEKRMSEIEQEYNLTRPTDEEYEDRRLEIVNNIISADDDNPTPSEEDLIDDALEEVEEIGEEEENVQKTIDLGVLKTSDIPDDATINQGVATWENSEGDIVQATIQDVDEGTNIYQEIDTDGDGVPDSIDPDSEIVEVVDTDFTNNQTNNETVSYMDSLGDIGNVLQQGLGIVNNIRQNINNQDDLVMSALGKKAYAEAMKEIKPVEYEGLSDMFKQHLNQVRELSKMGFSPDEKQRARAEIDAAYGKGIENAVRGTAGDRAKFLAMSGVLDSQRQSALLDFAAKDAELNRANMDKYTKALSFSEEYNLNKSKAERAEELQLELQKKKGASDFAGKVFQSLQERAEARRLAPLVNMYKSSLLQGMTTGHTDLSTPNIVTNNNNQGG